MSLKFWTNQQFNVQSAIGAAQVIDAITQASPGVVTIHSGSVLPSNGQYVLLEVSGMQQVNYRIFKVAGASGSTFNIGVDTSAFGAFTSGTYRVVTFGLAFNSVRDPQSSGGDPVFEDTTTVHDAEDTEAIVSSSAQKFNWTVDWDPTNATLIAVNRAFILRQPLGFQFVDPDGSQYRCYAYVAAPLSPQVSGKKKVTPISLSLRASGVAD